MHGRKKKNPSTNQYRKKRETPQPSASHSRITGKILNYQPRWREEKNLSLQMFGESYWNKSMGKRVSLDKCQLDVQPVLSYSKTRDNIMSIYYIKHCTSVTNHGYICGTLKGHASFFFWANNFLFICCYSVELTWLLNDILLLNSNSSGWLWEGKK